MVTHSFPVPTHFISLWWWFPAQKNIKWCHNSSYQIHRLAGSCLVGAISKYQDGMPKVARKAFNIEKAVTQHVAMVTKLLSSYCGAHLVESYCKESNISDTNWLRYLSSSYLIKIWLSVWRHQLANLHILKTWISLERKEIFENSKQHFSSYTDYFFMF